MLDLCPFTIHAIFTDVLIFAFCYVSALFSLVLCFLCILCIFCISDSVFSVFCIFCISCILNVLNHVLWTLAFNFPSFNSISRGKGREKFNDCYRFGSFHAYQPCHLNESDVFSMQWYVGHFLWCILGSLLKSGHRRCSRRVDKAIQCDPDWTSGVLVIRGFKILRLSTELFFVCIWFEILTGLTVWEYTMSNICRNFLIKEIISIDDFTCRMQFDYHNSRCRNFVFKGWFHLLQKSSYRDFKGWAV